MMPLEETQKVLIEIIDATKNICRKSKDFSLSIFSINKNEWRILMPPEDSNNVYDYLSAVVQHLRNVEYDGIAMTNIVDVNNPFMKDRVIVAYFIPKIIDKNADTFTSVFSSVKPGWDFGENRFGLVQYTEGVISNIMTLQ